MKNYQTMAFVALAALALPIRGFADDSDEIANLKKEIQALSQKVDDLETKEGISEAKFTNAPLITAGSSGFFMQSPHTNFTLHIAGFGQMDYHEYSGASPGAKDGFLIRRLRAIASGTVYKDYDYYFQTDFASGNSVTTTNNSLLQDAYLTVHYWPEFQIQGGKFKEPISLEVLPLDQYLWFLERGFPTELAPNRGTGIEAKGDLWNGVVSYQAGVFNGVPDNGSDDIETGDNSKDAVGRLFLQPFKNTSIDPLRGLGFGVAGSYGDEASSTTPSFSTVGRQKFFTYSNAVTQAGLHTRIDPQAYYFYGPFGAYFEYISSDQKFQNFVGKTKHTDYFQNTAWNITASYFLTGDQNTWNKLPDVLHPFSITDGGWGAWQICARFGELSLDKAAIPMGFASKSNPTGATMWGVSLNWYLNHNIKTILEYDQTSFTGGSTAVGSVTAQNEKAISARVQFGF